MSTDQRWPLLMDELRQHQAFMDMLVTAWIDDYTGEGGQIHCARGCSGCCTLAVNCSVAEARAIAVSLTEPQSDRVRQYVERLREKVAGVTELKAYLGLHRREMGGCPLLGASGACGVYRVRPLSCRALLSTMDSTWCSVDFSTLSHEEKQAFMAALDRKVTAFPTHYVASTRETGQDLELRAGERMQELFGSSQYGNMPVLVWLLLDHDLGGACEAGPRKVQQVIRGAGLEHPLLVSFLGTDAD